MSLPLNINWQQILLHLFNFVILGGGLYFLLYQPVKKFMDQRQEHYSALDQQATEKLAQAEQLKQTYESQLNAAQQQIDAERAELFAQTQADSHRLLEQAQQQAQQIVSDARDKACKEKQKILDDAQTEIANLAATATQKLLLDSEKTAFDQFLQAAEAGKGKAQ